MNMRLLRATLLIGLSGIERSKATDINFTIGKLLNKDQAVVNENANKDSDVFNTQRDLTAGIVGKSIGLKNVAPKHVANAHQKGISTTMIWTIALYTDDQLLFDRF